MSDEPLDIEDLENITIPAARRRMFVDALFANGFRGAAAMKAAGYKGKDLGRRACKMTWRADIQAEIRERFARMEAQDPRFASEAILHEVAEVAFMAPDDKTMASKVRALELLGKWRKLFVERHEMDLTVNTVEQFLLKRHATRNGNGVSA